MGVKSQNPYTNESGEYCFVLFLLSLFHIVHGKNPVLKLEKPDMPVVLIKACLVFPVIPSVWASVRKGILQGESSSQRSCARGRHLSCRGGDVLRAGGGCSPDSLCSEDGLCLCTHTRASRQSTAWTVWGPALGTIPATWSPA